ncbi:MAG: deoxynucleoside kinase [Leptolinea sp.]|jgi:deoxyadenosine/deoxycytidine kinase|nr:deoxynucleoside kinase [Leptolinea sp.]
MTKKLILVAGNIGSGKTSLTERIGQNLGWRTAYESVADNPYLPNFYADMRKWAFHLQVYFLGHRARQHMELWKDERSAIVDRSIYEDAFIFSRALNKMGNLSDLDYQAYLSVFDLVIHSLPAPSLLVYLKCPVPVLMDRIHSRARDMESTISADYLALLDSYYDEWLASFDLCPVLTLRTDDLDFVHKPEHMNLVISTIQTKLAGKEELSF